MRRHDYVVALYSCGSDGTACPSDARGPPPLAGERPADGVAQACGIPSKVLTARFDSMDGRFALLAWNRVALFDSFDPATAQAFAERWIDQAPEAGAC